MPCLKLGGGPLYQWDTGRVVKVMGPPDGAAVGYGLVDRCKTPAVSTDVVDGVSRIPDELLEAGIPVACWLEAGGRTLATLVLTPERRKKPAGYVSTPTDARTYETLRAEVERLRSMVESSTAALEWATDVDIDGIFQGKEIQVG